MARSEDENDSSSSSKASDKGSGEEDEEEGPSSDEASFQESSSDEEETSPPSDHNKKVMDNVVAAAFTKNATAKSKRPEKKVHKLSMAQTEDFNAKLKRRGVVYVARIPPRMTPTKIKRLLQEISHCEITRVYLVEEDASVRKRRRREHGSSGGKRYLEGWVEFASKSVAKHVAASLNTTPITNHKRSAHYGDLWNLKYLHKFQWSHLTEKVAYERRVKEQKLRLETMQARRETAAYKHLVETGQKLDKIEERKKRRRQQQQKREESGRDDNDDDHDKPQMKKPRTNKQLQIQPVDDGAAKATHKSLLGSLV